MEKTLIILKPSQYSADSAAKFSTVFFVKDL